MKFTIRFAVTLASITVFGQTKLISFRSHSGNDNNFRLAVENRLFNINDSNFGIITIHQKIDSVIRLSDKRIVIRRSEYFHKKRVHSLSDTLTRETAKAIFGATDISDLKAALQKIYLRSSIDSAHFIGFSFIQRKRKKFIKK